MVQGITGREAKGLRVEGQGSRV